MEKNNKTVVTRFSPSPTGPMLHIGGVRTMLYNYFVAKKAGGKFIIRLEDTDRGRFNPNFVGYLKETLNWLGITPDESPWNPNPEVGSYIQSERDYSKKIQFLLDNKLAYYAFDTVKDLENARELDKNFKYDHSSRMKMKNSFTLSKDAVEYKLNAGENHVIRFAVEPGIDITFNDSIRGEITINSSQLDDKVLIKSDGIAAYHMANTCDDHDMNVTHVIRGEEWIVSTPFHVLLYKAFGWDIPSFAHLPLIMNPDGKGKLSKRNSEKFGVPIAPLSFDLEGKEIKGWRESGYSPEVFINFMSLMGWHPEGDKELLSMNELIENFSLDRVVKHGAKFSMDKAKWMSGEYLKMSHNSDVIKYLVDSGFNVSKYSENDLDLICHICKDRANFLPDMLPVANIFFNKINSIKCDDASANVYRIFINSIDAINLWRADKIKEHFFGICTGLGIKPGKVMPMLRNVLTGGVSGPDLMTTMQILGKPETIRRLSNSF